MYKKIVVALALDHGIGENALGVARQLRDGDGEIHAVHVLDAIPKFAANYLPPGQEEKNKQTAEEAIQHRVGTANDAKMVVLSGHPGRTISDYASSVDADCIVVGSHKPGVKDFFLGSTAARVVRYATCSVHVLR